MVGDRGMITSARIEALKDLGGLGWITSLRAPAIRVLAEEGALQLWLFDEANLAEITHPDYPGERLVACRNPALAAERAETRRAARPSPKRTSRRSRRPDTERRPLRGRTRSPYGSEVLNRYKMAKHFEVDISEFHFAFSRKATRSRQRPPSTASM